MSKISIIVPVYNVENYLKDCIESIIRQSYKNIEIILVDDGSNDSSGKICDEYVKVDNRINVIHKSNGGLSSARNAGLDKATGDYIMFADSDDMLSENACEVLIDEIEKQAADFVIANYINCDDDGTVWAKPVFDLEKYKNFKLDINDYKDSFYILNSSVCNKIFNKKFIDNNDFRFQIGMPAEDAIFTTECFIKSNKVCYINDIVYYYRQRKSNNSISTTCSFNYFKGISRAYKIIYDNFEKSGNIGFYRCVYAKNMTYMLYKFIDSTLLTDEERIEILSDMRWFYRLSEVLNVPACQKSLGLVISKIRQGQYKDVIDICRVIADVRGFMNKEEKEKMSKPPKEMYDEIISLKY